MSTWGESWALAWGNSWGALTTPPDPEPEPEMGHFGEWTPMRPFLFAKKKRSLRDFVQLAIGADLSGLYTKPGPISGITERTP